MIRIAVILGLIVAMVMQSCQHVERVDELNAAHAAAIAKCGEQIRMLTPETYQGHCEIYSIWMERMEMQHCHRRTVHRL